MTEFVRFDRLFEHKDEESGQRTRYPAGWAGEVDPVVAKAARTEKAVAPAPVAAKPSAEVTAAQKAVSDAEANLAKARSEAEKAKAEAELAKARTALSEAAA